MNRYYLTVSIPRKAPVIRKVDADEIMVEGSSIIFYNEEWDYHPEPRNLLTDFLSRFQWFLNWRKVFHIRDVAVYPAPFTIIKEIKDHDFHDIEAEDQEDQ